MITPIQTVPVSMQIQSHYWFDMSEFLTEKSLVKAVSFGDKKHTDTKYREKGFMLSLNDISIYLRQSSQHLFFIHTPTKYTCLTVENGIPNVQILKANINKWSNKLLYTIIDLYLPSLYMHSHFVILPNIQQVAAAHNMTGDHAAKPICPLSKCLI